MTVRVKKILESIEAYEGFVETESHGLLMEEQKHSIVLLEKKALNLLGLFSEQNLDSIPYGLQLRITNALNSLIEFYEVMPISGPIGSSELFSELNDIYVSFFDLMASPVMILAGNEVSLGEISNATKKLESLLQQANIDFSEMNNIRESIVNIKNEANELLLSTKDSAQEVIVAKFGSIYKDMADKHRNIAIGWLILILLLLVSVGFISLHILNSSLDFMKTNVELLKYPVTMILWVGSRLAIFSAVFIGIGISIRNFKANMHNEVINRHRQNALNTFETFVKSSGEDKAVKDAILMEVTRTIFTTQNSGFSSADIDAESPSKIIEIIKNVSGKE